MAFGSGDGNGLLEPSLLTDGFDPSDDGGLFLDENVPNFWPSPGSLDWLAEQAFSFEYLEYMGAQCGAPLTSASHPGVSTATGFRNTQRPSPQTKTKSGV